MSTINCIFFSVNERINEKWALGIMKTRKKYGSDLTFKKWGAKKPEFTNRKNLNRERKQKNQKSKKSCDYY